MKMRGKKKTRRITLGPAFQWHELQKHHNHHHPTPFPPPLLHILFCWMKRYFLHFYLCCLTYDVPLCSSAHDTCVHANKRVCMCESVYVYMAVYVYGLCMYVHGCVCICVVHHMQKSIWHQGNLAFGQGAMFIKLMMIGLSPFALSTIRHAVGLVMAALLFHFANAWMAV